MMLVAAAISSSSTSAEALINAAPPAPSHHVPGANLISRSKTQAAIKQESHVFA